jgi:hypothetical protein
VAIQLENPSLEAPTTFEQGFTIQVFSGAFDPASA